VRNSDELLDDAGDDATPAAVARHQLAEENFVDVGHQLGRLADDEEYGDADEDGGQAVLSTLPIGGAVRLLAWNSKTRLLALPALIAFGWLGLMKSKPIALS